MWLVFWVQFVWSSKEIFTNFGLKIGFPASSRVAHLILSMASTVGGNSILYHAERGQFISSYATLQFRFPITHIDSLKFHCNFMKNFTDEIQAYIIMMMSHPLTKKASGGISLDLRHIYTERERECHNLKSLLSSVLQPQTLMLCVF